MLTRSQIEEYNEIGAIVVADILSAARNPAIARGHR